MADFWHVSLSLLIFDGSCIERLYQLPIVIVHLSQVTFHCPKLASSTVYLMQKLEGNYGTPLFNLLRIEQNSKFEVDSGDWIFFIWGKNIFRPLSHPLHGDPDQPFRLQNAANMGHFYKVQRYKLFDNMQSIF